MSTQPNTTEQDGVRTLVEVVAREETMRNVVTTRLSNVRFYTLEQHTKNVMVYLSQPKRVEKTSDLVRFTQAEASDIPTLFNIRIINSLDLTDMTSRPRPYAIIDLLPELEELLYSPKYAFIDPQFEPIRMWLIAAQFIQLYGNKVFKKPKTITYNGEVVSQVLDLTQFPGRDMKKYGEKIIDDQFRNDFMNNMKMLFAENHVFELPPGVLSYNSKTYMGDDPKNWVAYTMPFTQLEKRVFSTAAEQFYFSYHHPIDEVNDMSKLDSDFARVSPESCKQANGCNRNVRVPKNVFTVLDIADCYNSGPAVAEMHNMIESLSPTHITSQQLFPNIDVLRKSLKISTSQTTFLECLNTFMSPSSLSHMATVIMAVNINPNIFTVDINDVTSHIMENPFAYLALTMFLTFIPAYAVKPDIRRKINNRVIRSLLYKLNNTEFREIQRALIRNGQDVLPVLTDLTSWYSHNKDYAGIVYCYARNTLNSSPRMVKLNEALYYYFNCNAPENATQIIQMPGGIPETLSMYWPFYTGLNPYNYQRDTGFDSFRTARFLRPNGMLLPNIETDYLRDPDPTLLINKLEFVERYYSSEIPDSRGGLSADQMAILVKYCRRWSIPSLGAIYSYINANRILYSNCFAADGYPRDVQAIYKKPLEVSSKYFLTAFFYIDPNIDPNPTMDIILYGQMNTPFALQVFKSILQEIEIKCNLHVDNRITFTQLVEITTLIIQVFFNKPDFNPRDYFGYIDHAQWREMLTTNVTPAREIPLLRTYLSMLEQILEELKDDDIPQHVTQTLYIVNGAYMRGTGNIIALNSVVKSKLDIIYTVSSVFEYEYLMSQLERLETPEGIVYMNILEKLYYNRISSRGISPEQQLDSTDLTRILQDIHNDDNARGNTLPHLAKIPAIQVNARAYIKVNKIYETGDFKVCSSQNRHGIGFDEFSSMMASNALNVKNAIMPTIEHTVLINNVGEGTRPGPTHLYKQKQSILGRLPHLTVIAAAEDVLNLVRIHSMDRFLDKFQNTMIFRRTPFDILDSFKVTMDRVPIRYPTN